MSPRPNSRDLILDAAAAVAIECGAARMTLDAVAENAGLSKGGLMYHFPTKEALLEAMVARLVERFEGSRAAVSDTLPESPTRLAKAYVIAALNHRDEPDHASAAYLAAAANDLELLSPVRETLRDRFTEFADTGDGFTRAAIAALAVDGLWVLEMMRISPLTPEQRAQVAEGLLRFIDGG